MTTAGITLITVSIISTLVFFIAYAFNLNKVKNDFGRIFGIIAGFAGLFCIGTCIIMSWLYLKEEYTWKDEYDKLKKSEFHEYRLLSTDSIYQKIK